MADEPQPSTPQPSAAEALFFFSIVKNMKALSDIDWHAVAEDRGFKNAEVAKVRFGQVKRKLGVHSDPSKSNAPKKGAPSPSKVTKAPAGRSGTKGKRGGKVKKEEKDDDTMDEAPAKKEPKEESKEDVKRVKKSLQENVDAMIEGGSGDVNEPF